MTTGGYGYTVERSIAYAYLPPDRAEPGTAVEVEIFGEWIAGEVAAEPLFDPGGERIRGLAAQATQRPTQRRPGVGAMAQRAQRADRLRLDRVEPGRQRQEHLGRRQHVAGGVVGAMDRKAELARQAREPDRMWTW